MAQEKKEHGFVPSVVFVLGGPGAGKGTQCARLVKEFGVVHLSAGDLLRAEQVSGSKDGAMIADMIKNGQIVPAEVTVGLLRKAMEKSGAPLFLIDGFPRNHDNIKCFLENVPNAKIEFVLFFDCPESVMEERLLNRGKTSGRSDDNKESIQKRFKTYLAQTIPVIKYFREKNQVRTVSADNNEEAIYAESRSHILQVLTAQLKSVSTALLRSIDTGDWNTYTTLVDPSLTSFEPEGHGHFLEGLDFHKRYFDLQGAIKERATRSEISNFQARIVGHLAIVTYIRLAQYTTKDGGLGISPSEETRVFSKTEGFWKLVHFHRSRAPRHA